MSAFGLCVWVSYYFHKHLFMISSPVLLEANSIVQFIFLKKIIFVIQYRIWLPAKLGNKIRSGFSIYRWFAIQTLHAQSYCWHFVISMFQLRSSVQMLQTLRRFSNHNTTIEFDAVNVAMQHCIGRLCTSRFNCDNYRFIRATKKKTLKIYSNICRHSSALFMIQIKSNYWNLEQTYLVIC